MSAITTTDQSTIDAAVKATVGTTNEKALRSTKLTPFIPTVRSA
jgi:hypothetical protein